MAGRWSSPTAGPTTCTAGTRWWGRWSRPAAESTRPTCAASGRPGSVARRRCAAARSARWAATCATCSRAWTFATWCSPATIGERAPAMWPACSSRKFTSEAFDETASAWDNPDWLAVTVHSYTHRWGGTPGDPAYEELEAKLARNPPIQVPTIVLHGSDDGATLVTASEDKDQFFTAGYERRVLEGVGHFVPREAPSPAAKAILRLAT